MSTNYSTIQQHQPLRVPQGWNQQEKMLILQLDETFDDIYKRFGRLRLEDMGTAFRKRIDDYDGHFSDIDQDLEKVTITVGKKARTYSQDDAPTGSADDPLVEGDLWIDTNDNNKLYRYDGSAWQASPFSDPDKYTVQSDIAITSNGVEVTGNKYIKLFTSGTYVNMDASGIVMDGVGVLIHVGQTGSWVFDQNGLNYGAGSFVFKSITAGSQANDYDTGVFQVNSDRPKLCLLASFTENDTHYTEKLYWDAMSTDSARRGCLYAQDSMSYLGTKNRFWRKAFLEYVIGKDDGYGCGDIFFYPNQNADTGCRFEHDTSGTTEYVDFLPSSSYYDGVYLRIGTNYNPVYSVHSINGCVIPSSRELKHDIRDLDDCGAIIDALTPVSFSYDSDPERKRLGLIYEDTVGILPEICMPETEGKGIIYSELVPVLLKEIQSLRQRVQQLEDREG